MSGFVTIKSSTEGFYKEKGSKFISLAFPISSENDIQSRLAEVKKKYHDARHHCYAWILGLDEQNWRANDDGEPNHSAGDPILGQIRSHGLTNVLVVVVRYFGGTKLGVGGLMAAYKLASDDALSQCEKLQVFETVKIRLEFPYALLSTVERLISLYHINVHDRDFQLSCVLTGTLKKDFKDNFQSETDSLHLLHAKFD